MSETPKRTQKADPKSVPKESPLNISPESVDHQDVLSDPPDIVNEPTDELRGIPFDFDEETEEYTEEHASDLDPIATEEMTSPLHTAEDIPWNMVHPASVFINLIPQIFRILRGVWLILLFFFFAEGSQNSIDLSFFIIILGVGVYQTIIHYMTLRYRLIDDLLEIKFGLIYHQHRRLDIARIQNIELKQNPFHKLFGLTELQIETAGSSQEGLLSALSIDVAQQLRDRIMQTQKKTVETPTHEELLSLSTFDLMLYGLTSNQVGTVVVLSAIASEVLSLMNPRTAQEIADNISLYNAIGILLLSFAGSWIWSCARSILQHHQYSLRQVQENLQTIDGLITKRKIEIPKHKIQLILFFEPWLRRLMGYGTMHLETAALGMEDGNQKKTEGLVPMIERAIFSDFLQKSLPDVDVDPWKDPLLPAHEKALYRGLFRGFLQSIIPVALLMFIFRDVPGSIYIAFLSLLSLPLSFLDWKGQRWRITTKNIVSRRGYLNRKTWVIDRNKLQSIHLYQSPFMRFHNLAHIVVYVAGTRITLPDISFEQAMKCYAELNTQWKLPVLLSRDRSVFGNQPLLNPHNIK